MRQVSSMRLNRYGERSPPSCRAFVLPLDLSGAPALLHLTSPHLAARDRPGHAARWLLDDPTGSAGDSSAGRIGSRTTNVAPSPSPGLVAVISPWCWLTIRCVIDRPSPVPLPTLRFVKNGSKMFSSTSGDIPQPSS